MQRSRRFFAALLLTIGGLSAMPPCRATGSATSPSSKSAHELARLIVDKESTAWATGAQLDTFVDQLVYLVDPKPTWRPTDPLWANIAARVRKDYEAHRLLFTQDRREAVIEGCAKSYQTGLSHDQIDKVIALYRTEAGQRYLAFSADVMELYLTVMKRGREGNDRDTVQQAFATALASPGTKDERIMLAAGSRDLLAQTAIGMPMRTPGDAPPLLQQTVLMKVAATVAPEDWNALFARYRHDLKAVTEVERNPLSRLELSHSTVYGADREILLRHIGPYLSSWKATYWAARARQQDVPTAR